MITSVVLTEAILIIFSIVPPGLICVTLCVLLSPPLSGCFEVIFLQSVTIVSPHASVTVVPGSPHRFFQLSTKFTLGCLGSVRLPGQVYQIIWNWLIRLLEDDSQFFGKSCIIQGHVGQ